VKPVYTVCILLTVFDFGRISTVSVSFHRSILQSSTILLERAHDNLGDKTVCTVHTVVTASVGFALCNTCLAAAGSLPFIHWDPASGLTRNSCTGARLPNISWIPCCHIHSLAEPPPHLHTEPKPAYTLYAPEYTHRWETIVSLIHI
jgi:hypothetical protein